ncbi:hypothetical protein ABIE12_000953 [Serratia sp. 509]
MLQLAYSIHRLQEMRFAVAARHGMLQQTRHQYPEEE